MNRLRPIFVSTRMIGVVARGLSRRRADSSVRATSASGAPRVAFGQSITTGPFGLRITFAGWKS